MRSRFERLLAIRIREAESARLALSSAYAEERGARQKALTALVKIDESSARLALEKPDFTAAGLLLNSLARKDLELRRLQAGEAISSYAVCRTASEAAKIDSLRRERGVKSLKELCERTVRKGLREIEKREEAETDDDQRHGGDF